MWTFSQSGAYLADPADKVISSAYAGKGEGRNNPILQDIRAGCRWVPTASGPFKGEWVPVEGLTGNDWGPVPQGVYTILAPENTATHGPYVLWLVPGEGNEMYGRSGFGIHGDSREHPGLASEGCIVAPPDKRERVWNSGDNQIQVVA